MTALVVRAHAKINLDLRVLARRADGYHDLRTIFQSLALHDRLAFYRRRGAFAIESADPDMPRDATNLVWRAAQALWSASGRAGEVRGVRVTITKRIPSQAGLGGGSSDAAATLVALNGLWRTRFDAGDLARLAARLGADVPYFFIGGTALGLGRGEVLYPLPDVPSMGVLVVKPSFGVSTADAYRWYAAASRGPGGNVQALVVPWHPGPLMIANDLEGPVLELHPELLAIRRTLLRARAEVALMSGSGSAVFGLFGTVAEARAAAAALRRAPRGTGGGSEGRPWWLTVTRFLPRAAYRRRLDARGGPRLPPLQPIV
jgi:4-diphosphocytidyl-2-C-methyl-D-erythritol kinase